MRGGWFAFDLFPIWGFPILRGPTPDLSLHDSPVHPPLLPTEMQDLGDLGLKEAEGSSAIFSENLSLEAWDGKEKGREVAATQRGHRGLGEKQATWGDQGAGAKQDGGGAGGALTVLHSGVIAGKLHPVTILVLLPPLQRAAQFRALP